MVSSNFRQNLHDIVLNQSQPHQFENMGNNNETHVLENKEGEGKWMSNWKGCFTKSNSKV
jgi:hypothetical protein